MDREMPAVKSMLPLLKRGIGVHHSGLLPLLKEVMEILFQEQLIKASRCWPTGSPPGSPFIPLSLPAAAFCALRLAVIPVTAQVAHQQTLFTVQDVR